MKKKRVRIISVLISVMLVVGNAGAMVMAEGEQTPISYLNRSNRSESQNTCEEYTCLSEVQTSELSAGWYYLDTGKIFNAPLIIGSSAADEVNLILGDGCTLEANDGIKINAGTFNIFTESDDTGKIIATSETSAGIEMAGEGSTLNICGGEIIATGGADSAGIGGTGNQTVGKCQIEGGVITATGGVNGAGIGSGKEGELEAFQSYGGTVNATGGKDGAGIGGGKDGISPTLILGAENIEAEGKGIAPGIGAKTMSNQIVIGHASGTTIVARGGEDGGAGIGSPAGIDSIFGYYTILECSVQAYGGSGAAGIGAGYGVKDTSVLLFISDYLNVEANAGVKDGVFGQAFGSGAGVDTDTTNRVVNSSRLTVLDENDQPVEVSDRNAALSQSKATVQPCKHPGPFTYTDNGYNHDRLKECPYCTDSPSNIGVETHAPHEFDAVTHICPCGHQAYAVHVTGIDEALLETNIDGLYVAGGLNGNLYVYVDDVDRDIRIVSATYTDPEDGQIKDVTPCGFQTMASLSDRKVLDFFMPAADIYIEMYLQMNVTFDANGAEGSMTAEVMDQGTEYTLPDCGFTAPSGMIFAGWKIGDSDEILPAGEKITVDTDLTLVAQWVEANQATIKSGNVDFDGCIRLMFRMNFSPDLLSDSGLCVEVEKHGDTTYVHLDDTSLVSQKNGDYYISLPVPIPEFADDVTIRVVDGTGTTVKLVTSSGERLENDSFTYSVMTYAENKQNSEDQNMATLAKALYWYGVASQNYFDYDSGKTFVFDESLFPASIATRLEEFKYVKEGECPDGIEKTTIKAYFESDNTLSITFYTDGSVPVSDYEIIVTDHDDPSNAVTANLLYGSRKVSVEVENIPAPVLGKAYDFTISYGDKTYTITASPMTYALTSSKSSNVDRQHLGIAFFCYYAAAYDYFHGNGQI